MIWSRGRTSAKPRKCGCGHRIAVGERYVRWTASPDDPDLGNNGWHTTAECRHCATRYGRADLIEGVESEPASSHRGGDGS